MLLPAVGGECASQSISLRYTPATRTPGSEYSAGALHRFFFGDLWRDVWTTPVLIPVLDLQQTAGGLIPTQRGGGFQTASLRFKGRDGFQYKFRSLDKDPVSVLPRELRETFVASVAQDMIATSNPMAALVAAQLLNAVGILQAIPSLVIMPDDPVLGEYREEFGNRAGLLELHPDEHESGDTAFAGAQKISATDALFDKLDKSSEDRVHTASYLKARLMDLFLGDWDRHADQWRWARFDEGETHFWYPIPRDRDQVFARFDGLVPRAIAFFIPQIESCDREYPAMQDLSWSGRHLDRRFLADANWPMFDSLLTDMLPALSDSVLTVAVNALPGELRPGISSALLDLLKARRDGLSDAAREYYLTLSSEVDVRLSNKDDLVLIHRSGHDVAEISVFRRKHPGERIFHRRFDDCATGEIRVYCGGGDDSVHVSGVAGSGVNVVVLGGSGEDSFVDASTLDAGRSSILQVFPGPGAGTTFIDSGKRSSFSRGPVTRILRREPQADTLEFGFEMKHRDWGSMWFPALHGMWNADLGILLGGGATYSRFGFARRPHAAKISMVAGVAPMTANFDVRVGMDFRLPQDAAAVRVDALFTTFEVLNYFGMGNENRRLDNPGYTYTVRQNEFRIRPSLSFEPFSRLSLSIGGGVRYVGHDLDDVLQYLLLEQPYGYDKMLFMEGSAALRFDSRDNETWPRSGLLITADVTAVPASFDALETWTSIACDARTYLTAAALPGATLALRAAGRRNEGKAPFFASAFLGGIENLRGFEKNRFAGTSSIFTAAELRFGVADIFVFLPTRLGFLAFAENGRVWQPGESSTRWHASFGGGIWLAPVADDFTISASVASSNENLRFDLLGGFAF